MGIPVVMKVALALLAVPVTCMVLCTSRVQPVHGWMMRHHCLFARLAMHPPSRPSGVHSRLDTQGGHAMSMP